MSASKVITRGPAYSGQEYLHYTAAMLPMDLTRPQGTTQNPIECIMGNTESIVNKTEPADADTEMYDSCQPEEKFERSDFHFLTTLGTGTFARVWLVKPTKDIRGKVSRSELYALKILRKADVIRLKQCEHTRNERTILYHCRRHPFITRLVDSWSDWNSLYLLLDYAPGGELFSYLRRNVRFPIDITQFYAAEITSVLAFLHRNGVVYRDLKPENIMIDARGHIKLVDFGFSKAVGDFETYTLCGTPEYIAPEVLVTKGHGKAVDWWALGVFIFELACGYPPFYDSNPHKIYEKILAGKILFPSALNLPEAFQDIVRQLCTKDLSARLGNLRGGGEDVKKHPFFKNIDWEELEKKTSPGPIVPDLESPEDTKYFDQYPPQEQQNPDDYTLSMYDRWENYFRDF